MNKILIILMLLPINCFASGKLTLRQPIIAERDDRNLEIGLYVNESLTDDAFYQSWTGGQFNEYFTTNHEILHRVTDKLDIGLGASYRGISGNEYDFFTGIVLEYELWK